MLGIGLNNLRYMVKTKVRICIWLHDSNKDQLKDIIGMRFEQISTK